MAPSATCEGCGTAFAQRRPSRPARFCSRGCASRHAPRRRRFLSGTDHPSWKGGRYVPESGYITVLLPAGDPFAVMGSNGRVLEHRLVIARSLGRPLRSEETVHHLDGDPQNNAIANLQLRQGRHGKGASLCCADCGSSNVVPVGL